jgi:hypothetical protein
VNFLPTAPSLASQLRTGQHTYRKLLIDTADEPPQFQPRDLQQVHYFKSSSTAHGKLAKDEFLTLHELAYMLPGFIWSITTYKDLMVTCGLKFFTDMLHQSSVVLLSYDTTFSLGDFYLSILIAQIDSFNERPCFPVGYLIHDRKFTETHVEFFRHLKKHCDPRFQGVVVTDGEIAVANAVQQTFPEWSIVSCWNHIMTDIEVWFKKRHISSSEIAVYKSTVRELLSCQSAAESLAKFNTVSSTWSEAFKEYYTTSLEARVKIGARYHLQSLGLDVESVTNNISEGFNSLLKRHLVWQEVSVDKMALVLYELQVSFRSQVIRSLRGFGPFTVNQGKPCSKL